MAFGSFVGRVLFASVFILSAYQEFNEYGVDGGPIAKILRPKIDVLTLRLHSHVGIQMPEIETKHVVAAAIALKGIGGLLFAFGSLLGAYLLCGERIFSTFHPIYTEYGTCWGVVILHRDEELHSKEHKKKVSKTKTV